MAAIKVPEFPKAKLSNILTYNIAIVCMSANSSSNHDVHTRIFTNAIDAWKEYNRAIDVGRRLVAIGNIIAAMPVIMLVNRYGTRTHSIAAFYILRMIQGTALACNFPVIGYFTERWTYFKQNGMFIPVLVTYLQLAPAFTNPVSELYAVPQDGQVFSTSTAVSSLGLFLIYAVVFRNNPEKHPFVGNTEKTKIAKGKITAEKPPVPYLSIIKTPAIWGVWIAGLGNFTVINLLFLYTPTYLHKVVGFGETSTGLTSAIVPIAEGIVKIISGVVSDKLPIRESIKVRLFNTIAFIGSAVFRYHRFRKNTQWICLKHFRRDSRPVNLAGGQSSSQSTAPEEDPLPIYLRFVGSLAGNLLLNLTSGKWTTSNWNGIFPFVCLSQPQDPSNQPPICSLYSPCPTDWVYSERLKFCYRVVFNVDFTTADQNCRLDGLTIGVDTFGRGKRFCEW
ncbi:unnamed protein product, partial [Mesorhabditis belari]|uniref:Uncharacterized protein n=1 Tax=Mesorhabditis belari TaxID=2138241 RepID=A0AAF3F2Y2_9BILA